MKNEDNKCFRWCHIALLNSQDKYPHRTKDVDKAFINDLDYSTLIMKINKHFLFMFQKNSLIMW